MTTGFTHWGSKPREFNNTSRINPYMQTSNPSSTSMSLVRGQNLQVMVCQTSDVVYETFHGRCLMSNV